VAPVEYDREEEDHSQNEGSETDCDGEDDEVWRGNVFDEGFGEFGDLEGVYSLRAIGKVPHISGTTDGSDIVAQTHT
jgi:hypothetical protein